MTPRGIRGSRSDDVRAILADAGRAARGDDQARYGGPSLHFAESLGADLRVRMAESRQRATTGRPRLLAPRRTAALAIAMAVVVAVVALSVNAVLIPAGFAATADAASAAALTRDGATTELAAGAALRAGDEIKVGSGGAATLRLGGSYVRMSEGADLRLDALSSNHISVDQLNGRVYHRVDLPAGADYEVRTGSVTWRAAGTAFDLDREAGPGGEQVTALALVDSVGISGPGLDRSVAEGSSATIQLTGAGGTAGQPVVAAIALPAGADSWLAWNAGQDSALGLPLGWLERLPTPPASASAGAAKSEVASAGATTPVQTAPGSSSIPSPSGASPTPDRTPPTPAPSPTRSLPSPTAPPATPIPTPAPPPTPTPTPTPAPGIVNLGPLGATDNPDLTLGFSWSAYTGGTFSGYELVYELTSSGRTPSFLGGSPVWAAPGPGQTSVNVSGVGPGDYQVVLQAIAYQGGVPYVVGQTAQIHVHLSTARVSPSPSA